MITLPAQGGTGVPTKAHTLMVTLELLLAWLLTGLLGTVLSTLLIAFLMLFALPSACLPAPHCAFLVFAAHLTLFLGQEKNNESH